MRTVKLYDTDPHCQSFSAKVIACTKCKNGWEVLLDRTAFYPEGGGQACDTGCLGGAQVLDVQARDGAIVHLCTAPLSVEADVTGQIDWAARFDRMQQHSGEHMVSGLIHAKWGCDNVGFHMGADVTTIDFNTVIDPEDLLEIEQKANEAVWANLPVETFYPPAEELAQLPYRSKKALSGDVRLVRYPGIDLCACCGTHVTHTGEIGPIRLLSCTRFRDGVRIELVCGSRALALDRCHSSQNRAVSRLLSVKPENTEQGVARLLDELEHTKHRCAGLETQLFALRAEALRGKGDVLLFEPQMSGDSLRRLAVAIMETCGGRCAVFSDAAGTGYQYAIGQAGGDLRQMVKHMNAALQGRGGGKPFFVQGAVAADEAAIRRYFSELSASSAPGRP